MPFYEYYCPDCDESFVERHPHTAIKDIAMCPNCGTPSQRGLSMPNVHWKCDGSTGAGRKGAGRVDPFRHRDGSPLTSVDKQPGHVGNK